MASPGAFSETPAPAQTQSAAGTPLGEAQAFEVGQEVAAQWWSLLRSEPLDQLIRQSLTASPNLAAAQAALRQARENLAASTGSLDFPAVTGQTNITRERASGRDFSVFTAGVSVGYTIDVFGAAKRQLEGLQAGVDFQSFQVEAAYLTLTANVVVTAVREASLRAQLQATAEVLQAQEQQLAVLEKQAVAGAVARAALLAQRTAIAQTRATLPALDKSLAQNRHLLAVLAGRLPSEAGLPEFRLEGFELPRSLPLSLPSALVRQRPDIRASESLLHQASALVGVSTANLYPQISLSGTLGTSGGQLDQLFKGPAQLWSLGGSLYAPIFNGGALQARRRAAEAAYDQADAQYRQTVLTAFQNVADSLRAIESDAVALKTASEAQTLAQASLDLISRQFQLGAVGVLPLLDAERAYRQTRLALVQAQAARLTDTAVLFQALGGGWWQRGDPADISRPAAAAASAGSRTANLDFKP